MMNCKLHLLLVAIIGLSLLGSWLVSAANSDTDDEDYESVYKTHEARVYTKDVTDRLTPDTILSELRKMLDALKKLQQTSDIESAIDKTEKLIKLGELQLSECTQEMFDWYGQLVEQHEANHNIYRFVRYFAEELEGRCDEAHPQRNLRLKWLPILPPMGSDDDDDDDDDGRANFLGLRIFADYF